MVKNIAIILTLLFFVSGCAAVKHTAPKPLNSNLPPQTPQVSHVNQKNMMLTGGNEAFSHPPQSSGPKPLHIERHTLRHIVAPMETVWRISKMYDVPADDIIKSNHLGQNAVLKEGMSLVIPNAAPWRPVIPLYPSGRWKYIIIHHSATDEGNAFLFDVAHHKRGFWNGLGYHFVIDNGSCGKEEGQIEVSPRWIKQLNGAHCKANNMNNKSIGVCLVGNYSKDRVSDKQLYSLVYLVKLLQKAYNIPDSHIMGHGEVRGASTECPGKNFPWDRFWKMLREYKI